MECIEIEKEGVHRLIALDDAKSFNHFKDLGYKAVTEKGKVKIVSMNEENSVNLIQDAEIREAVKENLNKHNKGDERIANSK